MGWLYSQTQFCPPSAMPGFAHHQTDRYYANGYYPRAGDFNLRDFDYFGAPYSLLSSLAVGGLNSVICDIPARDEQEFLAFIVPPGEDMTIGDILVPRLQAGKNLQLTAGQP